MCHKYKTHPLFLFQRVQLSQTTQRSCLRNIYRYLLGYQPLSSASTDDTHKKGSTETTLPHGLDESYNHLSRDILFCVCCLVGRVKEHSARTYTSLILMQLLTSSVILHYIAVTIIVGIATIVQSIREHEDMTVQWVGEDTAWAHRHLRECQRLWLCTSCYEHTHARSAAKGALST